MNMTQPALRQELKAILSRHIGRGMARFQRYWCRQNWLSKIPYAEFDNRKRGKQGGVN